jgi:hypothetical protein
VASWLPTPDGHHCTRHDAKFKRGEVCAACVTDPGDDKPLDVGGRSVEIDKALLQRASDHRSLAKFLHREGREMIEEGTAQDKNVAVKIIDAGTKLERLAIEIEDRVSGRDYGRGLMEHEKKMGRGGGAN